MGASEMWRIRGLLVMLGAVAALAASQPAAAAPGECPTIFDTSALAAGVTGEGWTVSQGTTPEPFDVTVLGVLPNAIAPGRDMIIVEASSPAIDAVGGIWFGMSGSPVYVGGELIGAVAFGLTAGPSPIAGLTPASELLKVHEYPVASESSAAKQIRLPKVLARTVARRAGVTTRAASTLVRLKMPLSVSGVDERGLKRVRKLARRQGARVMPYRGASANAVDPADPSEIVPGGNFAAALSYGDVTVGGVGTTSYVCDGRAIAFGHPLFAFGSTSASASVADALRIVGDSIGGPFKLATIGGSVGVLDQDRIAGIRALLGPAPSSISIESSLTSLDTNRSRDGHTDAVLEDVLPDLAFLHVLGNVDSVQDAIGPGSAGFTWTMTGTDETGQPWSLDRQDMFASQEDLAFEPAFAIADEVAAINSFRPDGVEIDAIDIGGSVEETYRTFRITRVLVKREGVFSPAGSEISARPRQLVRLRVVMVSSTGGATREIPLQVRMPDRPRFTEIDIAAGPVQEFCEEEVCGVPATFTDLLEELRAKRPHNVLAARALVGSRGLETSVDTRRLGRYVEGQRTIFVSFDG